MAAHVSVTVYQRNQYQLKASETMSFPVGSFLAYPPAVATSVTIGETTTTINAVIEVIPSGLNQPPVLYLTDSTVTQVNTAANA